MVRESLTVVLLVVVANAIPDLTAGAPDRAELVIIGLAVTFASR